MVVQANPDTNQAFGICKCFQGGDIWKYEMVMQLMFVQNKTLLQFYQGMKRPIVWLVEIVNVFFQRIRSEYREISALSSVKSPEFQSWFWFFFFFVVRNGIYPC